MRNSRIRYAPALLAACLSLPACGSDDPAQALDAGAPDANAACEPTYTIYLNREGGEFRGGMNDPATNSTPIINGSKTVAGYTASDAIWDQAVACVKEDLAPFRIRVTETDPGASTAHMEIAVLDGDASVLDMSVGITSISPSSCAPILGIAFVFGGSVPQEGEALCKQMEFTVAKMFGIENHVECGDISSYDISSNGSESGACADIDATVRDADLQCGEFEAVTCTCTDSATSNSYSILSEHAGLCE